MPFRRSRPTLKPLEDQVMVITGASSGIGLATARLAAEYGTRLVLVARSTDALQQLADEITGRGGEALPVVADVSREEDVRTVAQAAIERFGGFDTWINNAATGAYAPVETMPLPEMRQLFEANFWGVVYGSRAAAAHLREQGGGAIINLGSEVSHRAVPLQGAYSASKHAVKGFTEALRTELEDEGAPISVTLIKPGQIDTPFTVNAKNHLRSEPKHVPPVYAPETVARAVLHAAEVPTRELFVGGGAWVVATLARLSPTLTDRLMEAGVIPGSESGQPPRRARDRSGLDAPAERLVERGNYPGRVLQRSLYTDIKTHPVLAGVAVGGATLLLRALLGAVPHRRAQVLGSRGSAPEKALRITLEARPGQAEAVEALLEDIRTVVEAEPDTRPWFSARRSGNVFEIFETFPNEKARRAHLRGPGAKLLLRRSNALLRRPARIAKLDLIGRKEPELLA